MAEIASGYFPDYDIQWDIAYRRKYSTQTVISRTGKQQRRRLFPASGSDGTGRKGGYAHISCTSSAYTPAQRVVVADFLDAKDGSFRAFYLFRRDLDTFTNYFVTDLTLSSPNVEIPFKESTVTAVTIDNVPIAFTVLVGVGTGGEDWIDFTAGDQIGEVRVTLRGRQRLLVIASDDEIIESFVANTVNNNAIFTLAFEQVR